MGAVHKGLFMPWLEVLALQVIQPVDSDAFTISTIYKKLNTLLLFEFFKVIVKKTYFVYFACTRT